MAIEAEGGGDEGDDHKGFATVISWHTAAGISQAKHPERRSVPKSCCRANALLRAGSLWFNYRAEQRGEECQVQAKKSPSLPPTRSGTRNKSFGDSRLKRVSLIPSLVIS
jgi:hypothetical protein